MNSELVLAFLAGEALYTILIVRATLVLTRAARRQDAAVAGVLRGADISDEAEYQEAA